jgi:DNA-binding response OmpR family regulator
MAQRVLIVEDEHNLAKVLCFNLEAEGFEAEVVDDGDRALARLLDPADRFDLVVLDVMLPGKDGFAVVSELRQQRNFVPVLMLTARGRPEDVLKGFAAGADDYLAKPTELAILLARIGGLLRRSSWTREGPKQALPRPERFTFSGKTLDFDTLELAVGERVSSAHADGSKPATLPDRTRGQSHLAQGYARTGVGSSRRYGHTRDRQLHRPTSPLHREGASEAEAPAHGRGVGYRFIANPGT